MIWPFKKKVKPVAFDCPNCSHKPICAYKDAFSNLKQSGNQMEQEHQAEEKNVFGISVNCRYCK